MASSFSKNFNTTTTPTSILKTRSALNTPKDEEADEEETQEAEGGSTSFALLTGKRVSFNQRANHVKVFDKGSSFNSDTSSSCYTPNSSNYSRSSDSSPQVINETLEDEEDMDVSLILSEDGNGREKVDLQTSITIIHSPLLDMSVSFIGPSDEEPDNCPSAEKRKKTTRSTLSSVLNSSSIDSPPSQIKLNRETHQQWQQPSLLTNRSRIELEPQPGPSRDMNTSINLNRPVKKPSAHAYRITRGARAGTTTRTSLSFGPFASTKTPKRNRVTLPMENPPEEETRPNPPPIQLELKTPENQRFQRPSSNSLIQMAPGPCVSVSDPTSLKTPEPPKIHAGIGIKQDDPEPSNDSALKTPSNNSSIRLRHQQTCRLESIPEEMENMQGEDVSSPQSTSLLNCTGSYEDDFLMENGSSFLEQDSQSQSEEEGGEDNMETEENGFAAISNEDENSEQELSYADSSFEQNDNNNNIDIDDGPIPQSCCNNSQCSLGYLEAEIQRFIQNYSDDDDPIRMYVFMSVVEVQLARLPEGEFNRMLNQYSPFFGEAYTNSILIHRRMYTAALGCRLRRMIYGQAYGLTAD